jgi:predicted ATP-dependent protease
MLIKKMLMLIFFGMLMLELVGCEAFVRKFTRKSKKSDTPIEMVLVPEEYKGPNMSKEEIYRQYYTYWSTWHDELLNSLVQSASLKKRIDCAEQALKNLVYLRNMLTADGQKSFDAQIARLNDLLGEIKNDPYGSNNNRSFREAEKIKSNIHKGFIYPKIKNYLL